MSFAKSNLQEPENNLPQLFNYENEQVRTITKEDGSVWFVNSDICKILDIKNPGNAIKKFKDNQKGVYIISTLGGNQELGIISESGLYKLVLKSRKKEAIAFEDWICEKVIPSIRKTGGYSTKENPYQSQIPKSFHEALLLAAQYEKEKSQLILENKIINKRLDQARPKIAFADAMSNAQNLRSLTQLGYKLKKYGLGPKKIFKWLREKKVLLMSGGMNYPYSQFDKHFKIIAVNKVTQDINGKEVIKSFDILCLLPTAYDVILEMAIQDKYLSIAEYKQLDISDIPAIDLQAECQFSEVKDEEE